MANKVPSVTKITRNGVEFTSRCDRTKYLLSELTRAALVDVGKYVRRLMLDEVRKLRGLKKGKRPLRAFQFWVRKRETDLIVGIKHNTWYGTAQELGTSKQPKRQILRNAVYNNIDTIRQIEGQYLSAIEDENNALSLIDDEYEGLEESE